MYLLVFEKGDLVFEFADGILKLLILEFKGLQRYNKGIFLFQNGIISFLKLFFLKLIQSLHLILPHHSQSIELFFYLFVSFDDFFNRLQCLFVLLLVVYHAPTLQLKPQSTDLLILISYGCEQLGSTHKSN